MLKKYPPKHEFICASCNKPFKSNRPRGPKYCSHICYLDHRNGINTECPACGKLVARGRRYCSRDCWLKRWHRSGSDRHEKRQIMYWKRKLSIITALGGKCAHCGINDWRVLEVDHINPAKKKRPRKWTHRSPTRFSLWAQEIDNLQLLCANCHRIKTRKESRWRTFDVHQQVSSPWLVIIPTSHPSISR